MADDSPPPKMRNRRPVSGPIVQTTSPGSGADSPRPAPKFRIRRPVKSDDPPLHTPSPAAKRVDAGSTPTFDLRSPLPSRRQQKQQCPLLNLQATEDENGVSMDDGPNSSDDDGLLDESNVTHGSHSDGEKEFYLDSLQTQDSASAFLAPLNHARRARFQSSFDPAVKNIAYSDWKGDVCPKGHKCFPRKYVSPDREYHCNTCFEDIPINSDGARCTLCDYDICATCMVTRTPLALAEDISVLPVTRTPAALSEDISVLQGVLTVVDLRACNTALKQIMYLLLCLLLEQSSCHSLLAC